MTAMVKKIQTKKHSFSEIDIDTVPIFRSYLLGMFIISRRLCQKNIHQNLPVYSVARRFVKHYFYSVWSRKKFLIQDKIRKLQYLPLQKCDFRTTRSLRSSGIYIFLGFILRIGAFLIGRLVRRWWARKSEEEKEEHKEWFKERRNVILGTFLRSIKLLRCYVNVIIV